MRLALQSGWLVVMHAYLWYVRLSLSLSRWKRGAGICRSGDYMESQNALLNAFIMCVSAVICASCDQFAYALRIIGELGNQSSRHKRLGGATYFSSCFRFSFRFRSFSRSTHVNFFFFSHSAMPRFQRPSHPPMKLRTKSFTCRISVASTESKKRKEKN